ncbi:hypothetical protein F5050DRAFT_1768502 [Lentinula boryana]|uniref:Uncharacterized protein n=1 Tax=Lentinula boryana TaxID=40481 RepID=A0ABQ8Q9S5_9AGAR|nr:hypothetical protein F5050DRAFT_1768502 [Lentinula boryana]
MHLLSSPAHLFSVVLLSIVLGVMTMAVPLTVHNTDVGKWQWHSKRGKDKRGELTVSLVRRYGPLGEDNRKAAYSKILDSRENWYLYITHYHAFHAVQENQRWQLRRIDTGKSVAAGLILGTIQVVKSANRPQLMADCYSKIETITGPSQFEALNALIQFLTTEIPKGLAYTPRPEDPDAWTKIFLAMTNYDQYVQKFPSVALKDQYEELPEGTTEAERAALISQGLMKSRKRKSQPVATSGGQPGEKLEEQGDEKKQRKSPGPSPTSGTKPEEESKEQGDKMQTMRIKNQMKISKMLGQTQ